MANGIFGGTPAAQGDLAAQQASRLQLIEGIFGGAGTPVGIPLAPTAPLPVNAGRPADRGQDQRTEQARFREGGDFFASDPRTVDFEGLNAATIGGALGGLFGLGTPGTAIGAGIDVSEANSRLRGLGAAGNLSIPRGIGGALTGGLVGSTANTQLNRAIEAAFGRFSPVKTPAQVGLGFGGSGVKAQAARKAQKVAPASASDRARQAGGRDKPKRDRSTQQTSTRRGFGTQR